MKLFITISKNWKRLTALFLLINFLGTPIITAFPKTECDEACEMIMPAHECGTDTSEINMKDMCCDMGKTNLNGVTKISGPEFSDINCNIIIRKQTGPTYIVPKTIENKAEFVLVSTFNFEEDDATIGSINSIQEISFDSSPPIYLMISSFLN